MRSAVFSRAMFLIFGLLNCLTASAHDRVDFNRDIRPILSDNCFYCHGIDAENRRADLRLDTFAGATNSGAVVPETPDDSELMRRILTDDADEVMPPPETEKALTTAEKDLIQRWIQQGAEYEEHWAWTPVERPAVPNATKGAAAIDAFLEAGWQQNHAVPVAKATPRERLRRLSLDLRGLPPAADDVAVFKASPTNEAYFAFRDRWMLELAYAEHQAVRWLDLVRWADTSGFVSDEPIASGAYRAWIIKAIHDNMPFDEFSIAQLAGDLKSNRTDSDMIASGYNRIVNTNCEAGAIEEEQLYKLKGEHVRAFGTVWMGVTTGCAECHDHKFDPFTAHDYYSLAAFFDDLVEAGVYTPGDRREPLHYVHDDSAASQRDRRLMSEIAHAKKMLQKSSAKVEDTSAWETDVVTQLNDKTQRTDFVWLPGQLPAARIVEGNFAAEVFHDRNVRSTLAEPNHFHRHHAAELMTGYVNDRSQKTDVTRDAWFADVWIDADNRPEMIGLQISHGDYGRLGWRTANYETYVWGKDTSGTLETVQRFSDPKRVKRVGAIPQQSGWVRLRVPFSELINPVGGQSFEAVGMAWLQTGGHVRWGDSGLDLRMDKATALKLGETAIRKWWDEPQNRQIYQSRAEFVAKAFRTNSASRNDLQRDVIADCWRESTQHDWMHRLRSLESKLHVLRASALPVLVSRQADTWKTTRVLKRGDYQDTTGPIVTSAPPAFISTVVSVGPTRLDLAHWLFDHNNPLTARVFVNRMWHQFYGRGISETLDDSGTQGDWPSHVELLDWLACEFRDSGWDRNHLVRLLTSTQAYQLSSVPTADLTERDPGNRWHARQSRHRLTAESIRDSALHAAGLLETTELVPRHSFFPYQPDLYWSRSDKIMYGSRHMDWSTSSDRQQYHRSLYTFWKRQNIHPTMLTFDAPTRQECTAQRNITNTPGQALALLNDPIFVEAARVMAMQLMKQTDDSDKQRIERAFSRAVQREPTASEISVLKTLLATLRHRYTTSPTDAAALVSIGQSDPPAMEVVAEVAAWTGVTRSILNLHEFLNRP